MNATVLTQKALAKQDWPLEQIDGLTVTRSPLLASCDSLVHAFTTRIGAHSEPPLNWFNLGRHWTSEESRQDAMNNRAHLCDALGVSADKLTVPGQQHTTNIYIVDPETASAGQRLSEMDGAATDATQLPLLLHFADCVPVILYDRHRRAICVIHAGWKGTAGGIAAGGVRLLMKQWGCRPQDIAAAVGPAIGSCCYPVGDDVAEKLAASVADGSSLIVHAQQKPHPDLKAINALQLLASGVCDIDVSTWCTACHPEIFYSHRQSAGKTGRQGAIACII